MMSAYTAVGVAILLLFYAVLLYGKLKNLKIRVDEAWGEIDLLLKKRYDLVPAITHAVRDCMTQDIELLSQIICARSRAMTEHGSKLEIMNNEERLKVLLDSILPLSERYPALAENTVFVGLMKQVAVLEGDFEVLSFAYNDAAARYNAAVVRFPWCIIAKACNFGQEDLICTQVQG